MTHEDFITLSAAAALLPRSPSGKRVAATSLWRWATKGCRGVRLRVTCFGSRYFTTAAWLEEFGLRLAEAHRVGASAAPKISIPEHATPTPTKARQAAVARARRELREAGVLTADAAGA